MKTMIKIRVVTDGMSVHYEYWHPVFWFIGYWMPFKTVGYSDDSQIREMKRVIKQFMTDGKGEWEFE
jgi:hypothetical protein